MAFYGASPIIFDGSGVSNVTATNSVELGTRVVYAGAEYVYVYNAGNSQISKGQGAVLSGVSGYSVTVSSVSPDAFLGVCKHSTLTTGTYGWLLTRGYGYLAAPANTGLAAGSMAAAGSDGVFTPATFGTGFGALISARVVVATASAGVAEGFIKCL